MKKLYPTVLLALVFLLCQAVKGQTPIYNSYPAAPAVIFLDFDGHTVTGTTWNTNGPFTCGPSNLNNQQITEIFNRVAEDYRPFNVNVTTDSTKYWSAPSIKRMRVVLTTSNAWYGNGAGGVAYSKSFTWGDNSPCFVFTALLGYNTKIVAEAAAHEAGHTLGLKHQSSYDANCVKTAEYNAGYGDGQTGWAPIMGVGYYRNFTTWNVGPTPTGCTASQNDLSIITGTLNGIGYRADDHGDTYTNASTITLVNNAFNIDGIINTTTDIDIFKIVLTKKGLFRLNGIPYNVGSNGTGSNLDMQVDLLDGKKKVIATYNPTNALETIVDTLMDEGTYYMKVDGTGNDNVSEYGSLGSYYLQGALIEPTTLPLSQLVLKGNEDGGKHQFNFVIEADESIVKLQLERSSDGKHFEQVENLATIARDYAYTPAVEKILHYRLSVVFDNGKHYYSNIVTIRNNTATTGKPKLLNTLVQSQSLKVQSPYNYDYIITDYKGSVLQKGHQKQGIATLNTDGLTKGMYLIRFINGSNFFVEKFMKQ